MVDALLGGFLVLSLASRPLLATNGWLAFRALGVSLAGAALFWCARTVARAGRGEALLLALAAAVVLGAVTGLAQAYGLVETNLASLTPRAGRHLRQPQLHGAPRRHRACRCCSTSRWRRARGPGSRSAASGMALAAAALVLSRSRAAWLGAGACVAVPGGRGTLGGPAVGGRRGSAGACGGSARWRRAGLALALVLPNRLNWRSDSPYLESLTGVANYKEGSGRGRLIQ